MLMYGGSGWVGRCAIRKSVNYHLAMTSFNSAAAAANSLHKKIVGEMANVKLVEASSVHAVCDVAMCSNVAATRNRGVPRILLEKDLAT
jgi:hypothetical protein